MEKREEETRDATLVEQMPSSSTFFTKKQVVVMVLRVAAVPVLQRRLLWGARTISACRYGSMASLCPGLVGPTIKLIRAVTHKTQGRASGRCCLTRAG